MDTAEHNGRYSQPSQQPIDSHMSKYPGARIHAASPPSPVRVSNPSFHILEPSSAQIESGAPMSSRDPNPAERKPAPRIFSSEASALQQMPVGSRPKLGNRHISIRTVSQYSDSDTVGVPASKPLAISDTVSDPFRQLYQRDLSEPLAHSSTLPPPGSNDSSEPMPAHDNSIGQLLEEQQEYEQLHYHHDWEEPENKPLSNISHKKMASTVSDAHATSIGDGQSSTSSGHRDARRIHNVPLRPASAALGSTLHNRGRSLTPQNLGSDRSLSPAVYGRNRSAGHSPDSRPTSSVDLLNISYLQQMAQQNHTLDNAKLRGSVGANASLLDTRKTLEMYRANVKKTNDPAISYEFALFMIEAAQQTALEAANSDNGSPTRDADALRRATKDQVELLHEARQILQRLADRSYVFAQYYLADGYASGLFNKGKKDYERAFPLFVSAGKHGHAESGFRSALCYEFGWGCRRDYAKAVQFYRQSASKGHPGAAGRLGNACLSGEMGLGGRYREGLTWLKRATESADYQHNSAPYELGLLHMKGYGDDIFKDEGYAAQLFTKAAELGHAEASLKMGEAYEHGLLTCPKDPALSIHFYTGAAQAGLPKAMMALCAWYMVGAEPLLEKDEAEAYEWAKKAAENGFAKAEYAVGYFTEMGIGCRRDPLEANVWYVRAADQGDERAKQRLQIIRTAETGDSMAAATLKPPKGVVKKKKSVGAVDKDDKDCIVM